MPQIHIWRAHLAAIAHRLRAGGMRVSVCGGGKGRLAGMLLVLAGVLLVFLCLPMRFFVVALGVALAATGLLLLR